MSLSRNKTWRNYKFAWNSWTAFSTIPIVSARLNILVTMLSRSEFWQSFKSIKYTSTLQCLTNIPCSITLRDSASCNKHHIIGIKIMNYFNNVLSLYQGCMKGYIHTTDFPPTGKKTSYRQFYLNNLHYKNWDCRLFFLCPIDQF